MGITRKQLVNLGFDKKPDGELSYLITPEEYLSLRPGKTVIFYLDYSGTDQTIVKSVVHLDFTSYSEFKKFLQDLSVGDPAVLKNQIDVI